MMKKYLAAAALVATFATTQAMASHCPVDVKEVGAALATNASLSTDQKTEVQSLMDLGAKQHADGNHGGSIETLHKARHMLGIDH